jgi:hypothetical protein
MAEIPPDLVARSDQMRAGSAEKLDKAIQQYRDVLADKDGEPNISFGYLVTGISEMLTTPSGERDVIFALAAAIERLSR